jgi:sulfur transfer complex TusBCD TusB component (DsrH family)
MTMKNFNLLEDRPARGIEEKTMYDKELIALIEFIPLSPSYYMM